MTISIEHYDIKVDIELPDDVNYDKVLDAFMGAMFAIGFQEKIVFNNTKNYNNEDFGVRYSNKDRMV